MTQAAECLPNKRKALNSSLIPWRKKIIKPKNQRQKFFKQINRFSKTHESISRDLTYM
jgi:hypothetical protein